MQKRAVKSKSVLYDWVVNSCSWREQTTLITAIRGPDGLPKNNTGKSLCKFLRSCVLRDATPGRGTFMRLDEKKEQDFATKFFNDYDEFPLHFVLHLFHAAEIVGYKHPDKDIRRFWHKFYFDGCSSFHMHPETEKQMEKRLKDDLI